MFQFQMKPETPGLALLLQPLLQLFRQQFPHGMMLLRGRMAKEVADVFVILGSKVVFVLGGIYNLIYLLAYTHLKTRTTAIVHHSTIYRFRVRTQLGYVIVITVNINDNGKIFKQSISSYSSLPGPRDSRSLVLATPGWSHLYNEFLKPTRPLVYVFVLLYGLDATGSATDYACLLEANGGSCWFETRCLKIQIF